MSRTESIRDELATIIQAGFIAQKTSDEVAGEILAHIETQQDAEILRVLGCVETD